MRGPVCKICAHKERSAINAALIDESVSLREITSKYGIAKSTLHQHKTRCMGAPTIPNTAERARRNKEHNERVASISRVQYLESQLPSRDELGGVLQSVIDRLDAIVARNEADGGVDVVAVSGLSGIRQTVADLAKLAGHVGSGSQTNVQVGVSVAISADQIAGTLAQHLSGASVKPSQLLELSADE